MEEANTCKHKKVCSNIRNGTLQSSGNSLVKGFQSKKYVMVKEANKCEHVGFQFKNYPVKGIHQNATVQYIQVLTYMSKVHNMRLAIQ